MVLQNTINKGILRQTFSNADATIASESTNVAQTGILSATRTLTLPPANTLLAGSQIQIVDESGTVTLANKVLLQRSGFDTVNGGTVAIDAIAAACGAAIAQTDGVNKWTVFFSKLSATSLADPQFTTWKSNVLANGGNVTIAQENAVRDFLFASKTSGTFSFYKLLLLPMGDLLAALNYLIYPGAIVRATNRNFVAADVTAIDGIKGNAAAGGTKYLDSGYNLGASGLNLDSQISSLGLFYFTRGTTTTTDWLMGAATVNGSNLIFDALGRFNGGTREGGGIGHPTLASSANSTTTNSAGLLYVNNEATRSTKFYVNGAINSSATTSAGTSALQNQALYLMASNQQGTTSGVTTRNMLASGVTIGMPSSLVPAMYSELNAVMTVLGR